MSGGDGGVDGDEAGEDQEEEEAGGEEEGSASEPNKGLIHAHAWIQTMSWALLAVMGLVMSRLARHWKYWMQLHIGFEVTATLLSFVGEMVAFSYSKGKVRYAHGALSFIILFASFPQVFLGWLMVRSKQMNLKKMHRAVGYFIVGIALWQMWMGMRILVVDERLVQCFYAWVISIGVSFHFASESVSNEEMLQSMVKRGFMPPDPATVKGASEEGTAPAKSANSKSFNTTKSAAGEEKASL
ncbi:unnamed protein product [Ostreobium quekettii]|uniref:Cytochrome b561 domain-containing protein n=1 Tax=Ostreobium quekettii TaxID=121088 RepID=A0A8S1IZV0_9CHLO|nr:unnamed protein product [Ostreobium quekettii]